MLCVATPRIFASASTSVIASGRASGLREAMLPGTIASVIASSESWPTTPSMWAISASFGPIWRSTKAEWCSRSRRVEAVMAGIRKRRGVWTTGAGPCRSAPRTTGPKTAGLPRCPSVLLPESLEAVCFVPLRRRVCPEGLRSLQSVAAAAVLSLSDSGRLRLRQRTLAPSVRFSHCIRGAVYRPRRVPARAALGRRNAPLPGCAHRSAYDGALFRGACAVPPRSARADACRYSDV
ncbi:hypothetical protein LUTEI9C_30198 [Luteimonas sp. 9C]|nr:hypothetical protein LUTEI9C_30198 [Luteimonas sp. 9C]